MKSSTKDTIKFFAALVVLTAGIVLVFISLFIPPAGVIDGTVLTALGEFLTFVGAIWGITEHSKIKIAEINRASGKRTDEED